MNLTSESLVRARPELEDLPEHLPRNDDRGALAARPAPGAGKEGAEDAALERFEESNCVLRDVYSGRLKLYGKEHERTLIAANNYANSLVGIDRFEEAKSLLRETVPVTQRVLGANHDFTLRMRSSYAHALYNDPSASLDDLREAVTTLEDAERIARRVLGGAHPVIVDMERSLRVARAALRAREAQPGEA